MLKPDAFGLFDQPSFAKENKHEQIPWQLQPFNTDNALGRLASAKGRCTYQRRNDPQR